MNRITLTTIFLTIVLNLFGQENTEYPSKEEKKYYRNYRYKSFKPVGKSKILNYKSNNFNIRDVPTYKPFNESLLLTPYQDSILPILFDPPIKDSIVIPNSEYLGAIDRFSILKHEKQGEIESFIYWSFEYEDRFFGEPGIWIGYSTDGGKNWDYYYTGIVQKQPVFIKWYSAIPLINVINDKITIQIEGALLRQLEPFTHPGPLPKYKIIKDGICIVFDLSTLSKDSDNDGLTDIVENKLHTDSQNKDTDNDSIPDNIDLNPRFNLPKTEKTAIYEAIINEQIKWDKGVGYAENQIKGQHYVTNTTETIMIETNNPDLLSVQPINQRIIFIREDEMKLFKNPFNAKLNTMSFSPMFKVDKMEDTYKLIVNFNTSGQEYLIKKTIKGWTFKLISLWIS